MTAPSKFKFAKQAKPYTPDLGDIIYGDDKQEYLDYIRETKNSELLTLLKEKYFVRLNSVCLNKFSALTQYNFDKAQIDLLQQSSQYTDPFYETKHFGFCPFAILCDSMAPYDNRIKYDSYLMQMHHDKEWNGQNELIADFQYLGDGKYETVGKPLYEYMDNRYIALHLGPGFTYGCFPSDGDTAVKVAIMDIEDSTDRVVCFIREWYNK
jgi:hypothetical protein